MGSGRPGFLRRRMSAVRCLPLLRGVRTDHQGGDWVVLAELAVMDISGPASMVWKVQATVGWRDRTMIFADGFLGAVDGPFLVDGPDKMDPLTIEVITWTLPARPRPLPA